MIVPTKSGWMVYSHNRKKKLGGPYRTRGEAERRLRQIEFFKHRHRRKAG